jgi:DNA-binding transcriptional ArsR family regulator
VTGIPRQFREIVVPMPRSEPKHFAPPADWPEILVFAQKVFTSTSRALILGSLAKNGTMLRAELVEQLGLYSSHVGTTLNDLEELGLVKVDLPKGHRAGRTAKYSLESDLYDSVAEAWSNYLLNGTVAK